MYIGFSVCKENGEFENGFALEVKHFNIHGFDKTEGKQTGLWFDIKHMDDEKERLLLYSTEGWRSMMTVGKRERIVNVYIVEGFPPVMPITKAEFRERFGVGKIFDAKVGHYKNVPPASIENSPPTFTEWKEWALERGFSRRVLDFLEKEPRQLTLGTPRGWALVAQMIDEDVDHETLAALIRSTLFDKDVAEKFIQFLMIG